jgi:hypothetical protein
MSDGAQIVNAVERAAPPTSMLPDAAQLELLRDANGNLSRQSIHLARGRGRPKGALNKRSKKVADYFVAKYGDPLDVMGQIMTMPTKQLVEILLEADGGQERAERLEAMVVEAIDCIKALRPAIQIAGGEVGRELADSIADAIEKLAKAAQAISGKPGKLALDALALQLQTTFRATEYVHGKQPIAVDLRKSADVVVVAPELLKEHNIDAQQLADGIATRGLAALDLDSMRFVEDAEFTEAESESDG